MHSFPWISLLIALPALGSLAVVILARLAPSAAKTTAVAIGIVEFVAACVMATGFVNDGSVQFRETHSWIAQFGVSYAVGLTGLGLLMVLLATLLVPIVLIAAWREQSDPRRGAHYAALVLALASFMVVVFAARDLFLFYVAFEAMLIPVYFLIGSFGGPKRHYAAVKFLLYSLVGGLIMLAALIALYVQGPGGPQGFMLDSLTGLTLAPGLERVLFLGFFTAFAIKAPMFPVHTWLPDAAQQAPVGTSVLLVGVLDKVGTFGMVAFCLPLFPNAAVWASPVIIVLAVISVLYGALLAIGQQDILRLIAYTSVSHFGFIVLGIFAFSATSNVGSAFYMLNHGLSTGALFLLAGVLIARKGSQNIDDFGGLQKVTPILAGLFLLAGLSAIALPGMSTFVSEFLVITGSFTTVPVAAIIAALGVILAALYILLTYQKVFTGPVRPGLESTRDASHREIWVIVPLLALLIVLGVYPKPATDILQSGAHDAVAVVQDAARTAGVATEGGE